MTIVRGAAILLVVTTPAFAQPVAATEPKAKDRTTQESAPAKGSEHQPTAADVANQPLPGGESGRTDMPDQESALRQFGRAVLFVPRIALQTALSPIHGAVIAEDRYNLDELYYKTFFNADRTIGLYPTADYATGFGAYVGARFVDRNLFGEHEHVAMQAMTGAITGDSYHEGLLGSVDTGRRLGRFQLGAEGSFDRRPSDPFYGIGNADVTAPRDMAVDPRSDEAAISTRYRYEERRVAAFGDLRLVDAFHMRLTGALADHAFDRSTTGLPIDEIYDTNGLVGWSGFSNAYGELELRMDERRRATLWEPQGLHGDGWLAAATLGRVHNFGDLPDFWRGSVELQDFIRFANGPRMLALRLRGEAVSASTQTVPFSELPMLGGGDFLRGYDFERFRDRVSALGSAEYLWDLSYWFDAAIFVDAGRVFPSLDSLAFDHLRVGYGAAIEVFGNDAFLFEASIASSIDGGVFFTVSFNPMFDTRPRWR